MGFRDLIGLCSHKWFLHTVKREPEPWDKRPGRATWDRSREPWPTKDVWICAKCDKRQEPDWS